MNLIKTPRIVFMGTPDFAVVSLRLLWQNNFRISCVVTNPDKPAGRGKKIYTSPIKLFAIEKSIPILQPPNFLAPDFLDELKSLKADLFVVVAFKILPEQVWKMPRLGAINLHASYLPQYRGAAPINRVIMNGEKETGVSTFFIQKSIDTGNILMRKKINISENETAGMLHDKLAIEGANVLVETIQKLVSDNYEPIPQSKLFDENTKLKFAPKIRKEDCRINWNDEPNIIFNQVRGLCPTPGAWTFMKTKSNKKIRTKIYEVSKIAESHNMPYGKILTDKKNFMRVAVKNGYIHVENIQLEGRKRLSIDKFLKGFNPEGYKFY